MERTRRIDDHSQRQVVFPLAKPSLCSWSISNRTREIWQKEKKRKRTTDANRKIKGVDSTWNGETRRRKKYRYALTRGRCATWRHAREKRTYIGNRERKRQRVFNTEGHISCFTQYNMAVQPSIVMHWKTVSMANPMLSKLVMPKFGPSQWSMHVETFASHTWAPNGASDLLSVLHGLACSPSFMITSTTEWTSDRSVLLRSFLPSFPFVNDSSTWTDRFLSPAFVFRTYRTKEKKRFSPHGLLTDILDAVTRFMQGSRIEFEPDDGEYHDGEEHQQTDLQKRRHCLDNRLEHHLETCLEEIPQE